MKNASSRFRGPMSKGICENSKALGTCQAKRNFTPRLRRGGGILWAYVWGKVHPFRRWALDWAVGTVDARQRSSVAHEQSAIAPADDELILARRSQERRRVHDKNLVRAMCSSNAQEYVQMHCIRICEAALHENMCSCIAHIAHKICTAMLDDKRNAYL